MNLQLSTTESKKLSKHAQQIQSHRYEDHLEGYQMGGRRREVEEKVQGLRSILSRYKRDRRMSSVVQEMEKSKNLYAQPMDMNLWG